MTKEEFIKALESRGSGKDQVFFGICNSTEVYEIDAITFPCEGECVIAIKK